MVISRRRQKIFQVYESIFTGDDYEVSSKERILAERPVRYLAENVLEGLEAVKKGKERSQGERLDISYGIKEKIFFVDPRDAWQIKPEYFVHQDEVDPVPDTCGEIKELLSTSSMSFAYVKLKGIAKEHKHDIMEEVYTITKGRGYLTISGNKYEIEQGETISVPKNEWHYLESDSGIELLVTTSPIFDPKDVILKQ